MNVRPELAIVHLQLTRRCNLRCRFCGQEHVEPAGALELPQWLDVLRQLKDYAPAATVVLWGGEPLLCPEFEAVASHAAAAGFPLELVTNGTCIHRFAALLRRSFRRIYVSVDGPEEVHDS
ncbi:MAG: radical SAM protein, partial [Victivallales bacterium]|nr:radical SAM protein [Victivallales bacterium]